MGLDGLIQEPHGHGIFDMCRKIGPVTEMPATANHGQVHTSPPTLHFCHQDINIPVRGRVNGLLVQNPGQGAHLIADFSSLFELKSFGTSQHARLQCNEHVLGLAAQKCPSALHIMRIGLDTDMVHTGSRTALYLIKQARARAIGKHRVFAGTQAKDFLQQLNRVLHRPAARIRSEVLVAPVHRASVVSHAREMSCLRQDFSAFPICQFDRKS